MSRKPSSRIRFELRLLCRATSRQRASQRTILCLQTTSSYSRRKQRQSLETHPGRRWLTRSLYRLLCHSVGAQNSDSSCSGLHSTLLRFLCLFNSEPMARVANGCCETAVPACSLSGPCVFV